MPAKTAPTAGPANSGAWTPVAPQAAPPPAPVWGQPAQPGSPAPPTWTAPPGYGTPSTPGYGTPAPSAPAYGTAGTVPPRYGYATPGYPVGSRHRRLGTLATTLAFIIVAQLAVEALVQAFGFNQTADSGATPANVGIRLLAVLGSALLGLASMAVGLTFVGMAAANAFDRRGRTGSPSVAWAVCSWIIPLAGYILGPLTFRKLWRESHTGTGLHDAWMGAYALHGIVATITGIAVAGTTFYVAFRSALSRTRPVPMATPEWAILMQWVILALHIVAGALFIVVSRQLAQAQDSTAAPA